NNIWNNEFGIDNTVTEINLDATNNWWGDAGGPGVDLDLDAVVGDAVSEHVNYEPWLPQWYPTAPTVVTAAASSLRTTSATLNGTLNDLGSALEVTVSFEWGTTTAYGNETTAQAMTDTGSFTVSLTGLSSNTTYHFRAVAVGDGTSYGDDISFTTARAAAGGGGIRRVPAGTTDVRGEISWEGVFEEPVTASVIPS
ncbi:unnamed protein product, partial [marine sediment metagenome]